MNSAPKYHIIKELGSGAQGAVYLVKDPLTRLKYAAKVVSINILSHYIMF